MYSIPLLGRLYLKTLERRLGLGSVIAIGISSMLGSGIFVLPGIAAATTGPSAWLAYLLAGIGILPAALSKSELSTAMPTSGGTYVYLERTFGPLAGTLAGLGLFMSILLKSSFALVGFGAYLSVFTEVNVVNIALFLLLAITLLNIFGVKKVSSALVFVVSISLMALTFLFTSSIVEVDTANFTPFMTHGSWGLISTAAMVYVSYGGVTKIAAIAEEVKDPEKNLPRGILWSLLIISIIYFGIMFSMMGIVPLDEISGSLNPIYVLSKSVFADSGISYGIAIIAVITMVSTANAGILAASRFPFAMSRDHLLPAKFGTLHRHFLTPIWSIVISGMLMALAIIFLEIDKIAKLASSFMIITFTLLNLTVIILRETRVQWYKPRYKSPLYPWMQIFGLISGVALLVSMGELTLVAIMALGIPSVLIYFLYGHRFTERKGVVGFRRFRKDIMNVKLKEDKDFAKKYLEFLSFKEDAKVVVSLFGKERSPETLIEMGLAISGGSKVEVAHLTELPEQTSLSDIDDSPQIRSLKRRIEAMSHINIKPISFDPLVSHDIFKTIFEITQRVHCQWLMIEWVGKSRGAFTVHRPMGWLKNHLNCHLVTFKDNGVRYIRKIMVFVRSSAKDRFVITTADHLAKVFNAEITLVRVVSPQVSEDILELERNYLEDLKKLSEANVMSVILESENTIQAIINESVEHDLVLFADFRRATFPRQIFSSEADRLFSEVACSVVSILPSR